jgi:hypothetical protein
MWQPLAYHYPNSTGQVLHLHKTIYGLKQSGHHWYQKLTEICTDLGFTQCNVDQAVFYCRDDTLIMVMAVHVDDCTIVAHPLEAIFKLKKKMGERVEVMDLGKAQWLLGIEITHDHKSCTLRLSQCAYIEDII